MNGVLSSEHGVSGFLSDLQQALKDRAYRPQPDFDELSRVVKRVYSSKADGKLRPLGIPTPKISPR